jgi:hypothetical protein
MSRTTETLTILLFLAGAGWLAVIAVQEIIGGGDYPRQYIDHPAGRVLTTTPLELGLTYEDVGESPPVN